MRGGGDLSRSELGRSELGRHDLDLPPDAELLEFDGGAGALGAVRIGSRRETEEGLAVLVPGYTGSREDFSGLLEPLADRGVTVVAYSQRGQLGSAGPGGFGPCTEAPGYALSDFVGDLFRVIDAVSGRILLRRIHLLGHSFGGLVGLAAVIERPDAFASYTHWNSGPRSRGVHAGHLRAIEAGGSAGLWEYLHPEPDAGDPGSGDTGEEWLRARMLATTSGNLWGGARILLDQVDRVAELKATGVPVLVSHGEFDDVWDPDWQRDMAERLGARYRVIPGGSHSPQFEEPEGSAEVLAGFWRTANGMKED